MKQIDIRKLDEIKERHWNYCSKSLNPANLDNQNKEQMQQFKRLCISNPFNFDNATDIVEEFLRDITINVDLRSQYESFRKSQNSEWNGTKLIKELGVEVCPYCGMNYFSTVSKSENGRTVSVATLDHYIPKESYPMLALNIYNLIPCCKNCNSTFKGTSTDKIINPYFYSLENNLKFKMPIQNIKNFIFDKDSKYEIEVENCAKDKRVWTMVNEHIRVLSIKERYQYFETIAKSILKKKVYYNNTRISELQSFEELKFKKGDIEKMLICQDIFNENEPFLKFKNDIWNQCSEE